MIIVYLDAWAIEGADLSPLAELGELRSYATTAAEDLGERIRDAQVVITNKVRIDSAALASADQLRLVVASATGMDHIDREACRRRGVATTNVAGYATESVAQYTLAAALELRILLRQRDSHVRRGDYTEEGQWTTPAPAWRELGGSWGIIGLGAIGRRVGELARAMGCGTSFFSASGDRCEPSFTQVSLDSLLASSDVISVHAPGVPRYRRLLDAKSIAAMKPSAVLIVAGRGGTVDEAAVAEAIREGRLGGAAFDVYAEEPPPRDNPLLTTDLGDRLLLTPHMAWTSEQALGRLVRGLADRVREHLDRA